MNKGVMVECLVNHYSNGNKSLFAKMLGVSSQTISSWVARNTFDAELIYAKCENVSADWLLSGEGEMIKSKCEQSIDKNTLPSNSAELIQLCKMIVANYQARDAMMSKLVNLVGNV